MRLLGVPSRDTGDGVMELPPGQATHLAAVLALRSGWVTRDELVVLLWPDVPALRGRHNLAQLLYAMRKAPWGGGLETEPQRVRWSVPTDVAELRRAASDGQWQVAAESYTGDLLEGVPEPSTPALAEWLRAEADDVRETWRTALVRAAEDLERQGDWASSARLLRRSLVRDGLAEDVVAGLIRAEALGGRRDAALRVYREFKERLLDELGLEPLDTTVELADAVRDGTLAPVREAAGGAGTAPARGPPAAVAAEPPEEDVRPGPVRGLAADATPFVGRALELAELHGLMRRGGHRLVTVHGPGGTGKSRLARRAARERSGHHEHGATWVPLAGAISESDMVDAVAAALGIDVDADALLTALAHRDLLVVLDQLEHLPDAAGLVVAMLDAAPDLQLLATSRSPLDVPGEAVMGLRGLTVPPSDDSEDAEAYDAIGLLLRAGRRSRPNLHPRGGERTALVALARLVGGSPLALELAAGWLRFLEPSELLEEVRRDLDSLRSREPDVDPAHASLGAVFESSWSLLTGAEREAVRRLSLFRGGCTRDSAAAVADVPLATLLALANRSLVYRDGNARFAMHPVVRHFAKVKLTAVPEERSEIEARHTAHFVTLAREMDALLDTPEQPDALKRLAQERPDITAVLERTYAAGDVDTASELVSSLGRSWRWAGRTHEGLAWTERLLASTGSGQPTAAAVSVRLLQGLMMEKAGDYAGADSAFERAHDDAERLADAALMTTARRDQALVAWRRGDLDKARALLEEVCRRYRALGLDTDVAGALANLGNVSRDAGDLAAAHAYYDEALALVEKTGHLWEIANTRNNKAIAYAYAGEREEAISEYRHAIELQRSIANTSGLAMTLGNLGVEYMEGGDTERAAELFREALALAEEVGDADGVAHQNVNLGILSQWDGAFDDAHAHYSHALTVRRDAGAAGLVTQSVLAFLDLAVARGRFERALVLSGIAKQRLAHSSQPLPAPLQSMYDGCMETVRANVAADRVTEMERRGEALPEADAIEYTLGTRALP